MYIGAELGRHRSEMADSLLPVQRSADLGRSEEADLRSDLIRADQPRICQIGELAEVLVGRENSGPNPGCPRPSPRKFRIFGSDRRTVDVDFVAPVKL